MPISRPLARNSTGFTLVELLITLAVAAILLAVGIPSFRDFTANQRVKGASQNLYMSLLEARSEAIKRNANVRVVPNSQWNNGWAVSADAAKDYSACAANSVNCPRVQPPLANVTVTGAPADVTFNRSGRLVLPVVGGSVSFQLCDSNASEGVTKRVITLDASGLPRVTEDGACGS